MTSLHDDGEFRLNELGEDRYGSDDVHNSLFFNEDYKSVRAIKDNFGTGKKHSSKAEGGHNHNRIGLDLIGADGTRSLLPQDIGTANKKSPPKTETEAEGDHNHNHIRIALISDDGTTSTYPQDPNTTNNLKGLSFLGLPAPFDLAMLSPNFENWNAESGLDPGLVERSLADTHVLIGDRLRAMSVDEPKPKPMESTADIWGGVGDQLRAMSVDEPKPKSPESIADVGGGEKGGGDWLGGEEWDEVE